MRIKNLLFSLCLALTLGGCSGGSSSAVELKLVDNYHGEYEVGFPIDVENFFYSSDRSQVSISASLFFYKPYGIHIKKRMI